VLCMDEVAQHKGHRDFVCVISDIAHGKVIEIVPSRTKAALDRIAMPVAATASCRRIWPAPRSPGSGSRRSSTQRPAPRWAVHPRSPSGLCPTSVAPTAPPPCLRRTISSSVTATPAPVLQGCDLRIRAGDGLLLEGPSGGGGSGQVHWTIPQPLTHPPPPTSLE
jgi:hypothetical protein